ncbi:hypothetical protein [Tissierella praeacuta]|uniref:hypothetical protein n=1 Tax=Tissierella praeacuta TaxID=43131 RepID=UPI002FDAA6FC
MIIKIIMFLIIGVAIGIAIKDKITKSLMKSKEDLIKTYKDLALEQDKNIKFYNEYIRLLENEYIEEYKKALNYTLKENTELRKKLKAYE